MIPVQGPLFATATTGLYHFTLVNETGEGIDGSQLNTLTLKYTEVETGEIVNGRDMQDVRNANDVSITTDAGPPLATTVLWEVQPEDTTILVPGLRTALHTALFRWTWDLGRRAQAHAVTFAIAVP